LNKKTFHCLQWGRPVPMGLPPLSFGLHPWATTFKWGEGLGITLSTILCFKGYCWPSNLNHSWGSLFWLVVWQKLSLLLVKLMCYGIVKPCPLCKAIPWHECLWWWWYKTRSGSWKILVTMIIVWSPPQDYVTQCGQENDIICHPRP
jgi:hypothetical protein